ncbi:MAG: hypothetical protein ACTSYB_05110 [Candidatus Helarchaeota archaeon]
MPFPRKKRKIKSKDWREPEEDPDDVWDAMDYVEEEYEDEEDTNGDDED